MFWKKAGYIVISILLIFSLLSVVSYRGVRSETVQTYGKALLDGAVADGYEVTEADGAVRYTPQSEGAFLELMLPDGVGDYLVLELAEPMDKSTDVFCYVSYDGMTFEEDWSRGALSTDGDKIYFFPQDFATCKAIRIEVREAFTVRALSAVVYAEEAPTLQCNWGALILLTASIALLLVFERRLGYFAWVRAYFTDKLGTARSLLREGRRLAFSLYVAAQVLTALLFATVGVLILFGIYSGACFVTVFVWTAVAVLLQLAARLVSGKDAEPAKLFLTVTLLLGLLLCYTMPACLWVSWDDAIHFRRAYDWAHLLRHERPYAAQEMVTRWNIMGDFDDDPVAFVYDMVKNEAVDTFYFPSAQHFYVSISYIPMIVTTFLLSSVGADIVKILVLCRLVNLLAYAILVYCGIRKLKSGAYIFSAVCLLPTALFLASSTNYDFWLTAWFAYAFSYLISELQQPEKKLELRDMIKILAAFFIGCAPKALYGAMLLPLLFLGKHKFESARVAKRFRLCTLAVAAAILLVVMLPALLSPDVYTDVRGGEEVSASGQIAFILSNPFRYAWILLKFLSEYISFGALGSTLTSYAYLGFSHPFFGTVSIFLLLFCVFTDRRADDAYESMQAVRWATLATVFLQVVLIITSMYVGFTPVGAETVMGCQQRYLLPLMLPFCYFLAPRGLRASIDSRVMGAMVFGGLAANVLMSYFTTYVWMFLK